jgi:hypothetical protein
MRHFEKIFIFTMMVVVLIYTVNVERDFSDSTQPALLPAPAPQSATKNEASFFPENEPVQEDESIIEETFTEVP